MKKKRKKFSKQLSDIMLNKNSKKQTSLKSMVLICKKYTHICISVSCSVMSDFWWSHGLYPTRLLYPWNSPGKNTQVGCHSLLLGIFPTQGLNLGLLHCRQILYSLSHQGSPIYMYMYGKKDKKEKIRTLTFFHSGNYRLL